VKIDKRTHAHTDEYAGEKVLIYIQYIDVVCTVVVTATAV